MHRAHKRFARELKNVDVVIEMRDARLPASSGNPELDTMIGKRGRLMLLNKSALADPKANNAWKAHFAARGISTLLLDADSRAFYLLDTRKQVGPDDDFPLTQGSEHQPDGE